MVKVNNITYFPNIYTNLHVNGEIVDVSCKFVKYMLDIYICKQESKLLDSLLGFQPSLQLAEAQSITSHITDESASIVTSILDVCGTECEFSNHQHTVTQYLFLHCVSDPHYVIY